MSKCSAALFALFSITACGAQEDPYRAPSRVEFENAKSVVIFLVDTLRADHLGCYGYGRDTSPRIDALAAEGMLFENCVAQSTWTKPASASVLTGLYPAQHGMLSESAVLPKSAKNIAELLKGSGLSTGAFAGNQYVYRANGEMLRGFDYQEGFSSDAEPKYARAEEIVDAALEWIKARGDEPFLAYVHTVDPHAPYGGTAPFSAKYVDEKASELDGRFVLENSVETLSALNAADKQRLVDLYDGDVAYTDFQLGRFLDGLSELGRDEDTAVIFVADHGEEFEEHGSWQHNAGMHLEVLKVPLIVRMPKASRATSSGRSKLLSAQIDVLPTALDALGLWPVKGLPGRSLFDDPGSDDARPVFSETEGEASIKAMYTKNYKYIRQWSPGYSERLFDLRKDPSEHENIAWDRMKILAEHREMMMAFIAQTSSGFSVLFQNPGDELISVDCYLTSTVPFDRVEIFYGDTKERHGALRDGPPELSMEGSLHKAHIRLYVEPVNGDGVSFALEDDSQDVRIDFLVDGQHADLRYIRMGPEAQLPARLPIDLSLADVSQLAMPRVLPKDKSLKDPYRILIWSDMRTAPKEVPLSSEERQQLEAIGYAAAEDEDE